MKSTESVLGSVISSSEAAMLEVTFWNICCSSIGVSIKFHSSNIVVARSCSCQCTDGQQDKLKKYNIYIYKLERTNTTEQNLPSAFSVF